MPVFFIPSTAIQGNTVTLGDPLYTHVHKSLRVSTGQSICVCDEQRQRHVIKIIEITKRLLIGEIQETLVGPPINKPTVTLAQSILKRENMVWGIQKATELGASTIAPIITERVQGRSGSNPRSHNRERWQKIALEAAQQSERWDFPNLLDPQHFRTFLQGLSAAQMNFILTEREESRPYSPIQLKEKLQTASNVVIAIGPEGGWSQEEIKEAENAGCTKLTLGEKILRSETAALAGLVMLQEQLGQLTFTAISERSNPLE